MQGVFPVRLGAGAYAAGVAVSIAFGAAPATAGPAPRCDLPAPLEWIARDPVDGSFIGNRAGGGRTVYRVDAETARYESVAEGVDPSGMVVGPDGFVYYLYALQPAPGVYRLDTVTGVSSLVSGDDRGRGPALMSPQGLTLLDDQTIALIDADVETGARVVAADIETGDRDLISGSGVGTGVDLAGPYTLVRLDDHSLAVADFLVGTIVRVDLASGTRSVIADADTPLGLAVEADGRIVVNEFLTDKVARIDPATGQRTLLSGAGVGNGPPLDEPIGIVVEPDGHIVVSVWQDREEGSWIDRLIRIDPVTGDRQEVGDRDGDRYFHACDNCLNTANADQRDTDQDGFGNRCDADFNGNCVVDFVDLVRLRQSFLAVDRDADLDGDGLVNFSDLAILREGFLRPPGPTGLSNACMASGVSRPRRAGPPPP